MPASTTTTSNTKGKNRKHTKTLEPVFYIGNNSTASAFSHFTK